MLCYGIQKRGDYNGKKKTVRPGTLRGYRTQIEQCIKPQLGDKQISMITTQDVQRMYRRLKKEGRVRENLEKGTQLSDSTIRGIHSLFHLAMKDAQGAHLIAKNPTEGTTVPKPGGSAKRVLSDRELDACLTAIQEDEIWCDFFYTELTTGLRRGELMALQWDDLDFKTGVLNVNKQIYDVKGELQLSIPKTKTFIRKLTLPPAVVAVLREYWETVDSRWMFPSPMKEDCPMTPCTVRKRLQLVLERAGCKHVRFHDLRPPISQAHAKNIFIKALKICQTEVPHKVRQKH